MYLKGSTALGAFALAVSLVAADQQGIMIAVSHSGTRGNIEIGQK